MEIDGQLWSLGEESAENDQQKDESFEEESVNRFLIYRILGCLVYSLLELPVKFCSEYPTKQIWAWKPLFAVAMSESVNKNRRECEDENEAP